MEVTDTTMTNKRKIQQSETVDFNRKAPPPPPNKIQKLKLAERNGLKVIEKRVHYNTDAIPYLTCSLMTFRLFFNRHFGQ